MQPDTETVTTEQPVDLQAEAMAGLDKGLEIEAGVEPALIEPAPDAKPEETPAADAKPEKTAAPTPDTSVEKEVVDLGLKDKSAARFRELSAIKAEHEPLKQAIEKAGIKDLAELPRMLDRVRDSDDMIKMVQETGATPEQFGTTLDYLRTVNAANRGDTVAANRLYEMLQGEMASVAKMIGKPVAGIYDPLSEHADLKSLVESGELDQKHAEELAGARSAAKFATERQTATAQQTQQQAQLQQAETQAEQAIIALDTQWKAADPQYAQRRPYLDAQVRMIRETLPPAQWPAATQRAYDHLVQIPMPAPSAPPTPRAGPVPLRAAGSRPTLTVATDDPMEALNMGLNAAKVAGR